MQLGLGTVTITTPGTPVRVTVNQSDPVANLACQSILIQALSNASHTNTGRLYVLDEQLTRVATLAVPTANTIPSFSATITVGPNALSAQRYYLDADNATDGADVSILIL